MAYQDRIDAALALIDQHNAANGLLNDRFPGYVDKYSFVLTLKAAGAVAEDDLRNYLSREKICKFLFQCTTPAKFGVGDGTAVEPVVLAAKVTEALKGNKEVEDTPKPESETHYVSSKKAHRMSHRELVENFDPEEPDSPVATRLKSLSKREAFIVFSQGRTVDVEPTMKLLSEIKAGHKGRKVVDVDGTPKKVYKLGEMPEAFAEENPLYPSRPLRPDGTCDQLNRSWAGVPLEVRQFLRVMLNENSNLIRRIEDAHYFLDIAIGTDPMKLLRSRYAEVSVKFDELKQLDKLPRLLIPLQLTGQEASYGRPFDDGKQVVWMLPPNPASNFYSNSGDRGWTSNVNVWHGDDGRNIGKRS